MYHGVLPAFKEPSVGSFKELGINENICYERKTKLGPYGYNEVEAKTISFKGTDWHEWQELCVADNIDRYRESQPPTGALAATAPKKERTAIVIRISSGRKFSENDKETIRALINELALRSGGEYQVFLLVHLTTETRPVWQDKDVYEAAVGNDVPPEFANMTILWSQTKMKDLYPNLDEHAHSIRASHWLPLQHFSRMFPQFEYLWDWPMDVRHTGHHYEALEKISQFAKKQPRKGLWERNERFYIPSVHGDYSTDFRKYVEKLSGTNTIWGPPAVSNLIPSGPKTPVTDPTQDQYQWGVGEEGDLVTLAPIFNPNDTQWKSKDEIWGYQGTLNTPRRASIGTLARVSRRLLNSMHIDNLGGNSFTTEMSPASVALLHGLKAVYAPVPVMFDTAWPAKNLDQSLNPGRKGESGSHQESPFGRGLETRLQRSTWYPQTAPGRRLYNNWMGWEDTGIGGSKVCLSVPLRKWTSSLIIDCSGKERTAEHASRPFSYT